MDTCICMSELLSVHLKLSQHWFIGYACHCVLSCVQLFVTPDFPGGSDSKDSTCSVGDLGLIPGLGRSSGGKHPSILAWRIPAQESLAGYSPWECKESDMTEQLLDYFIIQTVTHQAPLSMGLSQSRLPFPPPGDLPDPGIEPVSPVSPVLAGGFFTTEPPEKSLLKSAILQ